MPLSADGTSFDEIDSDLVKHKFLTQGRSPVAFKRFETLEYVLSLNVPALANFPSR